jgi:hypothetical protein
MHNLFSNGHISKLPFICRLHSMDFNVHKQLKYNNLLMWLLSQHWTRQAFHDRCDSLGKQDWHEIFIWKPDPLCKFI